MFNIGQFQKKFAGDTPHDQSLEEMALANCRLEDGIRQEGQAEEAARQGREDERSAVKERPEASWAGIRSEDFR